MSVIQEHRHHAAALTTRLANLGDQGTLVGWQLSAAGSGLAYLVIQLSATEFGLLPGDWRAIQSLAKELDGQEIAIVEGERSTWGCHSLRALEAVG